MPNTTSPDTALPSPGKVTLREHAQHPLLHPSSHSRSGLVASLNTPGIDSRPGPAGRGHTVISPAAQVRAARLAVLRTMAVLMSPPRDLFGLASHGMRRGIITSPSMRQCAHQLVRSRAA